MSLLASTRPMLISSPSLSKYFNNLGINVSTVLYLYNHNYSITLDTLDTFNLELLGFIRLWGLIDQRLVVFSYRWKSGESKVISKNFEISLENCFKVI